MFLHASCIRLWTQPVGCGVYKPAPMCLDSDVFIFATLSVIIGWFSLVYDKNYLLQCDNSENMHQVKPLLWEGYCLELGPPDSSLDSLHSALMQELCDHHSCLLAWSGLILYADAQASYRIHLRFFYVMLYSEYKLTIISLLFTSLMPHHFTSHCQFKSYP